LLPQPVIISIHDALPISDTGNVITDIDPGNGQDNAPAGTLLTSVTDATGNVITVPSGGIDVQGQFGIMHINQDWSYTYTLTNTSDRKITRLNSSYVSILY